MGISPEALAVFAKVFSEMLSMSFQHLRRLLGRPRNQNRQRHRALEMLEPRQMLSAQPMITEIMASNRQTLEDGNGRSSDWIEIYNAGDQTADLTGWFLTDDPQTLNRWRFPEVRVEPEQYLLVFASAGSFPGAIDQDGLLHANFKLSSSGETLMLVKPDQAVAQKLEFPKQYRDVSYGFAMPNLDQVGFFTSASPGDANGELRSGVTQQEVTMAIPSGSFTEPFLLELNAAEEGQIVYTLDGSVPGEDATPYVEPISISKSTQVRARLLQVDRVLGPTSTSNYVKLDAEVADFKSQLPIMVIDNFGAGRIPNRGWNQTNAKVKQLPRQSASLMLFDTDDSDARLRNAADLSSRIGIRVRGAFSTTFRENNYSVESWSDGDDSDAKISPLGIAADSDWVLYAPNPEHDQTLIDNAFLFELSNQMGNWAPEVRYVEAFVNTAGDEVTMDDYVGLYAITEKVKRAEDRISFDEFGLDGKSGGWLLGINRMDPIALDGSLPKNFHTAGPDGRLRTERDLSNSSSRGDDIPRQYNAYINYDDPTGQDINPQQRDAISAWFDTMESVLYERAEGVAWNDPLEGYAKYIDVDNFIDYFILNDISHNGDGLLLSMWLYNADPNGDGKLRFGPIWDADLGSYTGDAANELMRRKDRLWYGKLFEDPEFVLRYTERWQQWRRTVLSDSNIEQVIDGFYEKIGDDAAARDRVRNWRSRLDRMGSWLKERANAIDQLFVPAPEFSHPGGVVPPGFKVKVGAERGAVFLTLDGTDPRGPDGNPVPTAQKIENTIVPVLPVGATASILIPDDTVDAQIGTSWVQPDFVEGAGGETWISGATGVGYDRRGRLTDLIQTDLGDVDYSVYIRIPFDVSEQQLTRLQFISLEMQYDDGFVAYLNGEEIARVNAPGGIGRPVPVGVNSTATHRVTTDEFDPFTWEGNRIKEGRNVLAIQGLNWKRTDSDMIIRPRLVGVQVDSTAITIDEPTRILARTQADGEWSGPTAVEFLPRIDGDLNGDGQISADDVDRLCKAIRENDSQFDLTRDGQLDRADLDFLVTEQLGTTYGDANLDRVFDSSDLVRVFTAGQYDDGIEGNSSWATGDWNCDGEFDSADLVFAFQQGGYVD